MAMHFDIEPGARLVAKFKGETYLAEVGPDLYIEITDSMHPALDGKRFKSVSAAGSAVMGGTACNGWRFWSLADGSQALAPPATVAETPSNGKKATTQPRTVKLIKRVANQNGLPEGTTRWFCNACMKSFTSETTVAPEICPNGHRADDAELTGQPIYQGETPKESKGNK